ncbi:hypothetical protein JOD18_003157 [Gracilibacillus alcaliphilus]|nr:hypothetical protein [Gracilibacillus alcaliphilus]
MDGSCPSTLSIWGKVTSIGIMDGSSRDKFIYI